MRLWLLILLVDVTWLQRGRDARWTRIPELYYKLQASRVGSSGGVVTRTKVGKLVWFGRRKRRVIYTGTVVAHSGQKIIYIGARIL